MTTPMTSAAAEAYRKSVLDAVGTDDPLEVQAAEVGAWRTLVATAGDDLRTRPAEGEWSVLELLGHFADAELVSTARYRWVLAEDEPPLAGYDQEAWVAALHGGANEDPERLLALLAALRDANVALWRDTPVAARERVGIHSERGPESFELLFRMQAGHGRVHRAQAERGLAQIRAARG